MWILLHIWYKNNILPTITHIRCLSASLNNVLATSFCKMTTTRHNKQLKTTTLTTTTTETTIHTFNSKSIKTCTIPSIASSNFNSNNSYSNSHRNIKNNRQTSRRRRKGNRITDSNTKHSNNDDIHGSILSKSKCKTIFNRHLKHVLIVILVSFTFADMVHGECKKKNNV